LRWAQAADVEAWQDFIKSEGGDAVVAAGGDPAATGAAAVPVTVPVPEAPVAPIAPSEPVP
jgi:hypothetical protein